MKCHICNSDIPAGKKFCPGCGRVLSAAEQNINRIPADAPADTTIVYRPASTGKKDPNGDPSIAGIFSKNYDSPEYRESQAYSKATADVVEYDKMFLSRSDADEDSYDDDDDYDLSDTAEIVLPDDQYKTKNRVVTENIISQETDDEDEEPAEKRKLRINIKALIICIVLIAGIAIIVTGIYRVGEQIGLWGEREVIEQSFEEDITLGEKAPIVKEPESTTNSPESDYKIGIYTITSSESNVFMQKSKTDERIIATVPSGAVIEITEISDDKGKTTYGEYTGWLNMEELTYTPDAVLTVIETTTTAPEVTSEKTQENPEDIPEPENAETTTQKQYPASPGTYVVDLQGDGNYLNIRDIGTTDGVVVSTINDGEEVFVDTVENGWGHIVTDDGTEGWIYMVYLR